jgi:hypothetical protein
MSGLWNEVKPAKLKASRGASNWVFAEYLETPSQREDSQWFRVYLFRDIGRKIYGALVHLGNDLPKSNARRWAAKIITDETFREKHLTFDKELISLWKRR